MSGSGPTGIPTLRAIGEDALISQLTRTLGYGEGTLVGVGDDCAVLGRRGQKVPYTLLKTDCIVEGIHYLADADAAKVGWKAMARAVSDVAAMGGWPTSAVVTVVLHADTPLAFVRGLYLGFRKSARTFGFDIVGGETSSAPQPGGNVISVSMLGKVEPHRCVLRSTAKPGDAVFVTGRLGGSGKGRHLAIRPRLEQARWLVEHCKPSAMMDLSDGLAKDLPRLAAASGLACALNPAAVPRNRGCSIGQAMGDGEDYELVFTVQPGAARQLTESWRARFPRLQLTNIGSLHARDRAVPPLEAGGWDHFS